MGYSTDFEGELKFKREMKASELAALTKVLSKDRRDIGYKDDSIYENGKYGTYWYHIELELTENFDGIKWNGQEKTYDLVGIVNWLIDKFNLELEGELIAQGEDSEDRWKLIIQDGRAIKKEWPKIGQKVTCPYCEHDFILE